MKPAVEKFLRSAFSTSLPLDQIARRVRVSESTVKRFWAEQKAAGTLPEVRPHFADRCKRVAPASPALMSLDDDAAPFIDKDATPIAAPNPTYEHESGALLDALRRHHTAARFNGSMPTDWLRLDADARIAPSRAMLREFCRARDAGRGCSTQQARLAPAFRRVLQAPVLP